MKLFPKLVLVISCLITFQAFMTGLFVSNIIRNNNLEDSRIELRREAGFIYHNFSSWKRHLWVQLVRVRDFSEDSHPGVLRSDSLTEELTDFLKSSSVDAVIVKTESSSFSIEAISSPEDFILPPSEPLQILYNHPYIRLYSIHDQFYMIGTISLFSGDNPVNIFLIKHLNDSFFKNIVFDTGGRVIFHSSDMILTGNFYDHENLFSTTDVHPENAYSEQYNVKYQDQSYNIASEKCGTFGSLEDEHIVYLSTILSNEPFVRRIYDIERTVFSVSLITMLITAFLSMLISRGISRPVSSLAGAMESIRNGSYSIQLNYRPRDEIGILVRGFNDMADQLQRDQLEIEQSLNEITFLNEYNERVINSIRDAIAVVDESMRIKKNNSFFSSLFPGQEELSGLPFDQNVRREIQSVIRREEDFYGQRIRDISGRVFELKIYPLHRDGRGGTEQDLGVLLLEDISEKSAYEEKIFQAEKLSSISMLSAGIAHEINNPLSAIMTNIQNLIFSEEDPDNLETLSLVEDETRRIAQIIRDLLDFTSQEQSPETAVNPLGVAREVRRLVRHSRKPGGEKISSIEIVCDENISEVIIQKGELMQLFINLLQNAIHASPSDKPISLIIQENSSGRTVFIIRDRGSGIEEQYQKRVFDPFFTTKSNREGTGLGLSVVYGIILKYHGTIGINSTVGQGTDVVFELPSR